LTRQRLAAVPTPPDVCGPLFRKTPFNRSFSIQSSQDFVRWPVEV